MQLEDMLLKSFRLAVQLSPRRSLREAIFVSNKGQRKKALVYKINHAKQIPWSHFSAKYSHKTLENWRMRVAIIVTFLRQKPSANRSTLRQGRSHVPVRIRCGAVVGYIPADSRPARLLTVLKQSRVAVSYTGV